VIPVPDVSRVVPGAATSPVPGEREPGMLTTSGVVDAGTLIPEGPSTMDAATIAERQREGGGAPSQRRAPRERTRWWRRSG
jgi:hypothetical protein